MVGVRFRLQGRDAVRGLDCVGLIWAAYHAAGVPLIAPSFYPLRGWCARRVTGALDQSGLVRADDAPIKMGDAALVVGEAAQFHLGIMDAGRVIHAHAGLRRVVEAPLDKEWDAARRWRLPAA